MDYKLTTTQLICPKSEAIDLAQIELEQSVSIVITGTKVETLVYDGMKQACKVFTIVATPLNPIDVEKRRLAVAEDKQLQAQLVAEKIRLDKLKALSVINDVDNPLIVSILTINKGAPSIKCLNGGYTTVKCVVSIYDGYLAFENSEAQAIEAACNDLKLDTVSLHAALHFVANSTI